MPGIRHARITKIAVDRLQPGDMIRDADLKGFGVRRQKEQPVYFLQKRVGPKLRWMTIGPHGAPWTPETARREAIRMLGAITGGGEPRTKPSVELPIPSLQDAFPLFMTDHGPMLKPLSREKYQHLIDRYLIPALGSGKVSAVTKADVVTFHAGLAHYPTIANYAVAVLSRFMTWCEDRKFRPEQSNPCFRIKKFRENKRQRYLTQDEFARLGKALVEAERSGEDIYVIVAIRLLLLTGARVSEILTLKWTYIDFERRFILLPDSKTGQKVLRLNQPAIDVLRAVPRLKGNHFVIVGRKSGARLVNIQKPWRRIRTMAGLVNVRIHDLRHSYASVAAAQQGSLQMIGKLLGHSQPSTTARYAHLADMPLVSLSETIGANIANALQRSD